MERKQEHTKLDLERWGCAFIGDVVSDPPLDPAQAAAALRASVGELRKLVDGWDKLLADPERKAKLTPHNLRQIEEKRKSLRLWEAHLHEVESKETKAVNGQSS